MARRKCPKPEGWAPLPRCQAQSKQTGDQCGNAAAPGFEVCRFHGSRGGRKPVHGMDSKAVRTRNEFLAALGGEDGEKVRELIVRLHSIALQGNLEAIRYILDQLYGGPKSTTVIELPQREQMAAVVRVTARHLSGGAFESWLHEMEQELQTLSGSTGSESLQGG